MRKVRVGRTSAVFPGDDGYFDRAPGEAVGGASMCIIILSSKSNQYTHRDPFLLAADMYSPLGMLHPPHRTMIGHAREMFIELEKNPEEYGFLGYSDYTSNLEITKGTGMSLMYFRSIEHLHKFAHGSKSHRAGWAWWDEETKKGHLNEVTISHEIYVVPKGGWENIYLNAAPRDFGTPLVIFVSRDIFS